MELRILQIVELEPLHNALVDLVPHAATHQSQRPLATSIEEAPQLGEDERAREDWLTTRDRRGVPCLRSRRLCAAAVHLMDGQRRGERFQESGDGFCPRLHAEV